MVPVEVKFRKRIDAEDLAGLRLFQKRFSPPVSIVVTRELSRWDQENRILFIPLQSFLLSF